ncbi:MAG: 3-hydroxyisobutyrate dehydrogenase [Paracoccaceae bacterium]
MKVGFIGLGNMGLPMAEKLYSEGHIVTGFDLRKIVKSRFPILREIKEVVVNKDVIITMLPSGSEVVDVHKKIIPECSKSTVIVDCSTVDIKSADFVASLAKASNFLSLDAPVSGGVIGAKKGELTFMVGGDKEGFDIIKPLFDLMGKKTVYCGSSGSGQAAKICNNMILGISMIGVCEAFALADKIGLDRQKMFEVSSNSSGQCWSLNTYCPATGVGPEAPSDNNYLPGFASELMVKDLMLAQAAAHQENVHTPLGKHASTIYQHFLENGGLGKDFSAILPFLKEKNRS